MSWSQNKKDLRAIQVFTFIFFKETSGFHTQENLDTLTCNWKKRNSSNTYSNTLSL